MLLSVTINNKSVGAKVLLKELSFTVADGEKVAVIGRNGVGKTTLFNILAGIDDDYRGSIEHRRGMKLIATAQEHNITTNVSAFEYITAGLPEFRKLKQIIDNHPPIMGEDLKLIHEYTEALARFSELGFYDIEHTIERAGASFGLARGLLQQPFKRLSGGQKRFVELIKVMVARADVALIDEPTNHMDFVAKEAFNEWLQTTRETVLVITHDRDVLRHVDRIIEIKDFQAYSFEGNYDAYLRQNSSTTLTAMNQYEVAQRTIENIEKQIQYARSKKAGWGGTADKKNPFVVMEERLTKQLNQLRREIKKPSVWIDQESVDQLQTRVVERYYKYKDKNIKIGTTDTTARKAILLEVADLSLGYEFPLFAGITFSLAHGDRVEIRGRNGVGKTTLIKTILALDAHRDLPAVSFDGYVRLEPKLRIGFYEQEIYGGYLELSLSEAIRAVYREVDRPLPEQQLRRLLADYLFDPRQDIETPVKQLSGGQKARFQLIKMLAGDPNLLILDEPTNHLDLPSIEEMEKALNAYHGAILYVSHDTYFQKNLEGKQVDMAPATADALLH